MNRRPLHAAVATHYTANGEPHVLATYRSARASLRVLRCRLKELARNSGLTFSVHVIAEHPLRRPPTQATPHHYKCMEGHSRVR